MKLKELEKRLKQEPDNFGLRVQVAGLMRESGRSVEAVELYRSVALAYRDQGRTQQAIAVCRSILDIAPDDAACQGLLAMLQGRGSPSRPPAMQTHPSEPPARQEVLIRPSPLPPEKVPVVPSLRPPTKPPTQTTSKPPGGAPARRSSFDETPLPNPIPYHVSDPTSQPNKLSSGELDLPAAEGAETRPHDSLRRTESGLAQAARRISGLISDSRGVPEAMDLSAELDTRQRRKIESEELRKIEQPPPTVPMERILDEDEIPTPPPRDPHDELATDRIDSLTPVPRGSNTEELFTPPPRGSDDAITPPPLTGAMPDRRGPAGPPPPPRPSRPPPIVAIPPKRAPQSSNTPIPSIAKPRPPVPPSRPPVPRIPRDSDDELTNPREPDIDIDDDD